jgi:hypothetical protein
MGVEPGFLNSSNAFRSLEPLAVVFAWQNGLTAKRETQLTSLRDYWYSFSSVS